MERAAAPGAPARDQRPGERRPAARIRSPAAALKERAHWASPSLGHRSGRSALLEILPLVARSMPSAKRGPTRPLCLHSLMYGCETPAAAASFASEPKTAMASSTSEPIDDMRLGYRRNDKSQ